MTDAATTIPTPAPAPVLTVLSVQSATRLERTPLPDGAGWGIRLVLAPTDFVRAVRLYRTAPGAGRPTGLDEDLLLLAVAQFLADPKLPWLPLPFTVATELGAIVQVEVGGLTRETFAVIAELGSPVPAAVSDAPRLVLRDIVRALHMPDTLVIQPAV